MNIEVTPCSSSAGRSEAIGESLTRSPEVILPLLHGFPSSTSTRLQKGCLTPLISITRAQYSDFPDTLAYELTKYKSCGPRSLYSFLPAHPWSHRRHLPKMNNRPRKKVLLMDKSAFQLGLARSARSAAQRNVMYRKTVTAELGA